MMVTNLASLPVEVIELIACYVAIQVPFRPPTSLLSFILLNKQIYQLLRPDQNYQLYASIFRNLFDVKALERRLGAFPLSASTNTQLSVPSSQQHSVTEVQDNHSPSSTSHESTRSSGSVDDQEQNQHNDQSHQLESASDGQQRNSVVHNDDDDDGDGDNDDTNNDDEGDIDGDGGGGSTSGGSEGAEEDSSKGCTRYSQATLEQNRESKPTPTRSQDGSELCNRHLAAAYFERLGLFRRMRTFAAHPAPTHVDRRRATDLEPYKDQASIPQPDNQSMTLVARDLWLIYLMVLENDGRNWSQLTKSAHIIGFLLNYFHYEINPSAISPGYPSQRPEISIALRLCHLFLDLHQEESESQSDSTSEGAKYWTSEAGIETYLFALKPYTFASHQYDVAYAPWSIRELPIDLSSPAVLKVLSQKLTGREKTTLAPLLWDTAQEEQTTRGLDVLSHQAVIGRSSRGTSSPRFSAAADPSSISSDCDSLVQSSGQGYCELAYMGKLFKILPPLHSHVALLSFFWCNIRHTSSPGTQALEFDDQLEFFLRMMRSVLKLTSVEYDREFVRQTTCLDPFFSPGLRFDFYRGCFRGGWDGQFGFFDLSSYRQMLLGRIESVYEGRYGDQNQVFKVQEFIVRVRDGQPVEFLGDCHEKSIEPRRLAHCSEEEPLESEIERLGRMKSLLYPTPIESILVKYDPSERYELQIHGAGHSSWGHFKVKGRVRAWDGMVTFLKIYDTGRHGRWLYRGYHAPGNMIVGRWRDTLTSEATDGYEGTFVMFTRN